MQCLSLSFLSHEKPPRYRHHWPRWRLPACLQGNVYDAAYGKCIVAVASRDFCPHEVETLLGVPAKGRLGWTLRITFDELVAKMVGGDLKVAEHGELVKKHGYMAMDMRATICMAGNGRSVLSDLKIENRERSHKILSTRLPLELVAKWPQPG